MFRKKIILLLILGVLVFAIIKPESVMAVVGQWGVNGSSMYYSDGWIGLGTSTPAKMLDVRGSMNASKVGAGGMDADNGYPAGWGGGIHSWDIYAEGAIGVGSGGSVNAKLAPDGSLKVTKLGSGGMDPINGYPSGWGGGVHTWDIYAEDVIGVGTGGSVNAVIKPDGTIKAKQIYVMNSVWPDYVFSKNYKLESLNDLEKYINKNKHLPGVPSADEISKDDQNLGDIQRKEMEKIEELTLYVIKEDKKINDLETQNNLLKEEISLLRSK